MSLSIKNNSTKYKNFNSVSKLNSYLTNKSKQFVSIGDKLNPLNYDKLNSTTNIIPLDNTQNEINLGYQGISDFDDEETKQKVS